MDAWNLHHDSSNHSESKTKKIYQLFLTKVMNSSASSAYDPDVWRLKIGILESCIAAESMYKNTNKLTIDI